MCKRQREHGLFRKLKKSGVTKYNMQGTRESRARPCMASLRNRTLQTSVRNPDLVLRDLNWVVMEGFSRGRIGSDLHLVLRTELEGTRLKAREPGKRLGQGLSGEKEKATLFNSIFRGSEVVPRVHTSFCPPIFLTTHPPNIL